jgi:hypothetical protein
MSRRQTLSSPPAGLPVAARAAVPLMLLMLVGCASTKTVPFTIQSDPLGGYVLYRVTTDLDTPQPTADWLYLGNTPLQIRREIGRSQLKRADAFTLRIMKEGYFDQEKSWSGDELMSELGDKGRIFWNPRLVNATQ